MKRTKITMLCCGMLVFGSACSKAQGTVTFNTGLDPGGLGGLSLSWFEGMSFRIEPYAVPVVNIAHVGAGRSGHPNNGTAHIEFSALGVLKSVVFAQTNAALGGQSFLNGAPFGLQSVDLADSLAPSLSPISITFNGFKGDGSMVSQTFSVGGGGSSSFRTVAFSPDFSSGLLRVEIPSPRWAMDNLVWVVPEPGTASIFLLGVVLLSAKGRSARS